MTQDDDSLHSLLFQHAKFSTSYNNNINTNNTTKRNTQTNRQSLSYARKSAKPNQQQQPAPSLPKTCRNSVVSLRNVGKRLDAPRLARPVGRAFRYPRPVHQLAHLKRAESRIHWYNKFENIVFGVSGIWTKVFAEGKSTTCLQAGGHERLEDGGHFLQSTKPYLHHCRDSEPTRWITRQMHVEPTTCQTQNDKEIRIKNSKCFMKSSPLQLAGNVLADSISRGPRWTKRCLSSKMFKFEILKTKTNLAFILVDFEVSFSRNEFQRLVDCRFFAAPRTPTFPRNKMANVQVCQFWILIVIDYRSLKP